MRDIIENILLPLLIVWSVITALGMAYGTMEAREWPHLRDPMNNVCMGQATHLSMIFPGAKWGCWIGSPVGFHLWDNKLKPLN